MKQSGFKLWLQKYGKNGKEPMGVRPIGDAISRCKRIEQCLKVDLDDEFEKDGGRSIVSLLEYSADDVIRKKPAPAGLYFKDGADIKNGMASLKAAAKKYFEYRKSTRV